MKLEDTCKIKLEKNKTQKVKCYIFFQTEMERELAVHPNIDNKGVTNITDVKTGYCVCKINEECSKVKEDHIAEALDKFIKHFTLEGIREEFKRLEEKDENT